MVLWQRSWAALCMGFRLMHLNNSIISITMPIITFIFYVWSFMLSVGFRSSKAYIIILYNCRLCITKNFLVIKSIWIQPYKRGTICFIFCIHLFSQFAFKNILSVTKPIISSLNNSIKPIWLNNNDPNFPRHTKFT